MKIVISTECFSRQSRVSFRRGVLPAILFVTGVWISPPSLAQRPDGNLPSPSRPATENPQALREPADSRSDMTPSNFGTADGIDFWIPAYQFVPFNSSSSPLNHSASYYFSGTGAGNGRYFAHLPLPQGARITGYRVFYLDNDPIENFGFGIQKVYDDVTASPTGGFSEISSFISATQSANFQSSFVSFVHTVDLREPFAGTTQGPGEAADFYTAFVDMPDTSNVAFKGVRFFWSRQVSPAPQTATFSDVPVGHPQHRFVEALAAAGLTAGCTGGNYCPDAPLTRGQMAVFLSGALGLHWPPF